MLKTYNFGAGPACLPPEVLAQVREDLPDWFQGMSVMEISHRHPVFIQLTQNIENDLRTLLSLPEDFAICFMQGGARAQFSAVPLNLLGQAQCADYLLTGHWSELAYLEAQKYTRANVVANAKAQNYTHIPEVSSWKMDKTAAYFHYTDNETIHGVEFHEVPKAPSLLICDMTSNILTKPIDFTPFGLIYASTQKNLGIAGLTVVLVRKSLLEKAHPLTPSILNYAICTQSQSMQNTPPVFCWYVLGLMLKWAFKKGGLDALTHLCEQKAKLFYDVIDSSDFYRNPVAKDSRSRINVPFYLPNETLEKLFLQQAQMAGLQQLKGHKISGGVRASFYNAMPLEGVQALVAFMQDFEKTHG